MDIVWSESALHSYLKVIDYLFENWTRNEVIKFEEAFDSILENVISNTEICPKSKLLGYRKCIIDKHNSLIYTIVNNKIFLISIIDNRSSHGF